MANKKHKNLTSSSTVYNYAQHPLNFVLYHCPEKNADNDGKPACKRHAMKLYKPQSAPSDGDAQGEVTTLDGVKLKMKIAEDRMEYNGIVVENAKFMLLDGANFKLFDPMLDSGAAGSPQIDGVFSLALGNGEFRSGMEQLLDKKAEKIATVYMQPFQDLDFFSKTTARVSVGQLNQQNCAFAEKPEWLGIVKSTPKNWKIDMEVKISGDNNEELLQLSKQQVLISTSGTFIFAPKSVTDLLTPHLTLVNDNSLFKLGRSAGKAGLAVKDVLIECPTEEQMKKLPTIKFALGKQTFTLTPKEYIFKLKVPLNPVKGTQKVGLFNWCHPMIRERPETGMYAKFMLPENNKDQWLFGQLFFNKACVAFKYGETPQLALAPTIANPTN